MDPRYRATERRASRPMPPGPRRATLRPSERTPEAGQLPDVARRALALFDDEDTVPFLRQERPLQSCPRVSRVRRGRFTVGIVFHDAA